LSKTLTKTAKKRRSTSIDAITSEKLQIFFKKLIKFQKTGHKTQKAGQIHTYRYQRDSVGNPDLEIYLLVSCRRFGLYGALIPLFPESYGALLFFDIGVGIVATVLTGCHPQSIDHTILDFFFYCLVRSVPKRSTSHFKHCCRLWKKIFFSGNDIAVSLLIGA
jgi:hypothetical protein